MEDVLFKLEPDPTFWAPVEFKVAGGKLAKIQVEFRYKDRDQYLEFIKAFEGKRDDEVLPQVIVAWKGPDAAATPENIARMFRNYPGSSRAFFCAWRDELFGAPAKN